MARMRPPWRAMMLAGVFALAACEPGLDTAAPAMSGVVQESITSAQMDLTSKNPVTAVVANGLESLVLMSSDTDDEGLLGAGCRGDAEKPLPDGDWFGFVMEATNHTMIVDIACVYGPDTDQFQAYSSDDVSPLSSYVVINDVIEKRELRFGPDAQAYMAADKWQPRAVREVVEEARANPHSGPRGVWLRIEDGRIGAVVQPYSMGVAAD